VGSEGVWVKPLSDIDRLSYVQVVNMDTDQSLATGEVAPSPADAHPYKNLK
jgi:hypothetical protein